MDYDKLIRAQQSLMAENEAFGKALECHQQATDALVEANNDLSAAFVRWQEMALQYHEIVKGLFDELQESEG